MKTLIGSPPPEPKPNRPEIIYCVTELGPGNGGFVVAAPRGRFSLNAGAMPRPTWAAGNTAATATNITWTVG